jgi:hypothetical protein
MVYKRIYGFCILEFQFYCLMIEAKTTTFHYICFVQVMLIWYSSSGVIHSLRTSWCLRRGNVTTPLGPILCNRERGPVRRLGPTSLCTAIPACWPDTYVKRKIHFWPSNFCLSFILAIELENRVSLTIQLLKPFTIGHEAVLMSGFNFFYLQFSPYILKWLIFFARTSDLGDSYGQTFIPKNLFSKMFFILFYHYLLYYSYVVEQKQQYKKSK